MSSELRAGVFGVRRGRSFVRVMQAMDGVSVVAVADMNAERRQTICEEHSVPHGYASLEEMLEEDLDLVVVATPVPQHAEHSIQVLEAGVNVLSEIPNLATREEADQLVAAAEKSDALYMCGENCSYWAYVHSLKHLNQRGDFGEIFAAEAEYIHNIPSLRRDEHGNRTWRSPMPPITYLTHSLGPIMWVTGQYPVEVVCLGTKEHYEPDLDDIQVAIFRMTDDSIVRISCSFANSHWGNHRQVFMGTKATFDSGWIGKDEPKFRYARTKRVCSTRQPADGHELPQRAGSGCPGRSWYCRVVYAKGLLPRHPQRRACAYRRLRRHHVQSPRRLRRRIRRQRRQAGRHSAIPIAAKGLTHRGRQRTIGHIDAWKACLLHFPFAPSLFGKH